MGHSTSKPSLDISEGLWRVGFADAKYGNPPAITQARSDEDREYLDGYADGLLNQIRGED